MSEYLIDTSAWIEYLLGTERGVPVCDLVENKDASVSVLTVAELSCWLEATGRDPQEALSFLREHARLLPVEFESCAAVGSLRRAQRKKQQSFGTSDGIIYLTARERGMILLTKDKDFAGLPGVKLLA